VTEENLQPGDRKEVENLKFTSYPIIEYFRRHVVEAPKHE
jgi:hypothetical protein